MKTVGSFQLLEELGRGAMGVVYRGFDPAIGRPVAIKVIRAAEGAISEEKASLKLRFAREATAAGKLSHPNIVTIYHFGEEGDLQYLVMELVNGESLEKVISAGRALEAKTAISMLAQVADALDHAHSLGVVHRDVKPANILVRPDGKVKITDFGIARIASQTFTQTGFTMGTPAYMSPEQVVSARVGAPADQFSLGVIAFQMLSGRRPFEGDTGHALMYQIVSVEAPLLHTINSAFPPQVSKVVAKALAKKPEDRFSSCKEFVDRLAEAFAVRADQDAVDTATMKPAAHPWRNRWAPLAIVGALAVAIGLAGVVWWNWPSKPPAAQAPARAIAAPVPPPAKPQEEKAKAPVNPPAVAVAATARPGAPAPKEPQPQHNADLARRNLVKTATSTALPAARAGGTAAQNDKQLNHPPAGFTALFDGKDLSGWRGRQGDFDPDTEAALSPAELTSRQAEWNRQRDQHWRVDAVKGEIVADGQHIQLATIKNYDDFELYVNWMIDRNADSGIYLRGYPQVQIWDPEGPGSVAQGSGKGSGGLYNNRPNSPAKWPLVKADNPTGQWNTFHIKMAGSLVSVWLNDRLVVDWQVLENSFNRNAPLVPKGPIELQGWRGEVRFRNIYIREIYPAK